MQFLWWNNTAVCITDTLLLPHPLGAVSERLLTITGKTFQASSFRGSGEFCSINITESCTHTVFLEYEEYSSWKHSSRSAAEPKQQLSPIITWGQTPTNSTALILKTTSTSTQCFSRLPVLRSGAAFQHAHLCALYTSFNNLHCAVCVPEKLLFCCKGRRISHGGRTECTVKV